MAAAGGSDGGAVAETERVAAGPVASGAVAAGDGAGTVGVGGATVSLTMVGAVVEVARGSAVAAKVGGRRVPTGAGAAVGDATSLPGPEQAAKSVSTAQRAMRCPDLSPQHRAARISGLSPSPRNACRSRRDRHWLVLQALQHAPHIALVGDDRGIERLQHIVHADDRLQRKVACLGDHHLLLVVRLADDALRAYLRLLQEAVLARQVLRLLAGKGDNLLRLVLRALDDVLALLQDAARLLDLVRDGGAHLINDLLHLPLVHLHLAADETPPALLHHPIETINEELNIYRCHRAPSTSRPRSIPSAPLPALHNPYRGAATFSRSARLTCGGTSPLTSPPSSATSRTRFAWMNEWSELVIKQIVS